ncbi:chromosome replication initiation protein [Mesomycoplasma dispar]|uniref:Chromosome replication initiation protein n=1 Tax=Mesomycoplasma dispar TaxID=86660 RepID=A0ABN5DVC8_9BACT|nr:chromosome replication initiation protein [Mesomycoplasma dispar]ATP59677.1 chromosome replication initiation protein [Mesomycoplasma dispar]
MQLYFVTSSSNFSQNDLNNLLYFYLPIVKHKCFSLFHYFLTIKNLGETVNYTFLENVFKIGIEEFHKNREILESLNLIETLYDSSEKKYFINLKTPLNSSQIDKNPYLKSLISDEISLETYSNLMLRFKKKLKISKNSQIDTTNFYNLSKKFYEIFGLNKENTTNIINFPENFDNKTAKEELNFEDYHLYLTKKLIRPRTRNLLYAYQNEKNFSNYAINSVIEYSYKVNNDIVFNYMKKILDDLWKDEIIKGSDVDLELNEIFKLKIKNSEKQLNSKVKNTLKNNIQRKIKPISKSLDSKQQKNSVDNNWIFNELNSGEGWL